MRNILNILLPGLLLFGALSCSEDIMDDINKNVNDPTDVASNLIITDAITTTAFSIAGSDLAFYASIYVEHNVGIWNQSYNAEIRSGEPISATTYNNSWNTMYNNLYNLRVIIDKCSEGGSEEGNYHTLGIAQALSAYTLATLTDLMGDVPWSEALQPGVVYTPVLDSQESIYEDVNQFLDDAIANLEKETDFASLGGQDFIYGGDAESWKKFAYGLKARYAMRLANREANYADVVDFVGQSFTSPAEQFQYNYAETNAVSPFYKFFTDRDYFGASASLRDKLNERNDPRLGVFFMAHPDADDLEFAPNGEPAQAQNRYGVSAITNEDAPTYVLSYHELKFLEAEALVRQGAANYDDAKVALREAITAAFQKENIGLTDTDADTYFDDEVEARFDANPLAEVMNQKYLAFYEEEAIEAYNDYRRLVAMGDDVINLDNPRNDTQFPLRFTYGASDVTTNEYVRSAYGDGTYVYTENVWWAGGTR